MKKNLFILGAGESGTGAAILGKAKGWNVLVSDSGVIAESYKAELNEHGIHYEEGAHSDEGIQSADLVIKSPGIPEKAAVVQLLRQRGVEIISEIEFGARYSTAKLIAITGTNGKTTTTSICYHILKKAGVNVGLGGNIGKSFARQVAQENYEVYVLEVSSFQLDGCYQARFHIAILCNITPDHLDRYDYNLDLYAASKFRILQNQQADDVFIYNSEDPLTIQYLSAYPVTQKRVAFGFAMPTTSTCAWVKQDQIIIQNQLKEENIMSISELSLKGRHNVQNTLAAAAMASAFGIRRQTVRESMHDFQNVEHRLESVGKVKGIEFINDSKATNVNSAWYALECMFGPVVWIAGGVDKGNDYEILKALVREKVRVIVCLGLDNRKIHEAFAKEVDIILNTQSMQEAVNVAYHMANKEETVLLSPACASFDLFQNYEDRGRQFKKYVKSL